MNKEKAYAFRDILTQIHKENLIDNSVRPSADDFIIKNGMTIGILPDSTEVIRVAAEDFAHFLSVSMGVSVKVTESEDADIFVGTKEDISFDLGDADCYKGFCTEVGDKITVCGFDDRGAAQGLYFLEDEMSERRAPFLKKKTEKRAPLYSPRMVHSGYALDVYPDRYLAKIAHSGRDAIVIFIKDLDHCDKYNDLIVRAAKYGIDVYAYNYMTGGIHPDDPGARENYANIYGKLFANCPGFKGLIFVGESAYFQSKDPHVSKITGRDRFYLPNGKPNPGYWPCEDYPAWINLIKDVVREQKPDADIVFWTYNTGWVPEKERVEFIEKLPTDISLLVTYEMYEQYKLEGVTECTTDYTIVKTGPAPVFTSEAEAAKKRGIRLYGMTNTGGQTWDIGTIPYIPVAQQWIARYKTMAESAEKWGMCGLMESHHFGFYPSFIGDLSKNVMNKGKVDYKTELLKVLGKYYKAENAETVEKALALWSEAITNFIPSEDDQYGPFRVGPSFPFCLKRGFAVPSDPDAHFGSRICFVDYGKRFPQNYMSKNTYPSLRVPVEIKYLEKARELMTEGIEILEGIFNPCEELEKLINLGRYIVTVITTGINMKHWYITKNQIFAATDRNAVPAMIDKLEAVLIDEKANAQSAVKLVETDSRLGWEPSMEYVGGAENILWKIKQVEYVLNIEIPELRKRFEM
ncbi:MAG: hypothetical protein IKW02_04580 [Clostridia bacterium]|nr:hypothetical protein [Clostridia bacterium]